MFGRKAMRLAPADMGTANTRIASHWRRRQRGSSPCRPDPCAVSSATLRHQHDVAVSKVEVLLLAGGDLVVVERDSLHRGSLGMKDYDLRSRGELREPTGQRERVQRGGPALELEPPGTRDLSDDRNLEAPDFRDDHRDFWGRDLLGELLRHDFAELERGEPAGLDVVQRCQREL